MLTGIILGIIAMFCFGSIEIALKKVSQRLGTIATVLYRGIFVLVTLFLFMFFTQQKLMLSWEIFGWSLLCSFFGSIAFFSFTHALKIGKVSLVSPIAHGSAAITVLLAVLFYQEQLSAFQGLGILLVIVGTAFVSFKWQELRMMHTKDFALGLPYALITFFAWGITFFLYKIPVELAGPMTAAILLDGFLFLAMILALFFSEKIFLPTKKEWGMLAFIGVFSGIAVTCLSYGFSLDLISMVTPIVYASPLVTILLARHFLEEKLALNQYLGIMSIIIGILLLAF